MVEVRGFEPLASSVRGNFGQVDDQGKWSLTRGFACQGLSQVVEFWRGFAHQTRTKSAPAGSVEALNTHGPTC